MKRQINAMDEDYAQGDKEVTFGQILSLVLVVVFVVSFCFH